MLQEHAVIISEEFNLTKRQVAAILRLIDAGDSIPFIARYRKDVTGGIDEQLVRKIASRHEALTALDQRKDLIRAAAKELGQLTPELAKRIADTNDPILLDDIYMPYKPRRKSRAEAARAAGLAPLAEEIWAQTSNNISDIAKNYVSLDVTSPEAAIDGALDILAERVNESEKARNIVRSRFQRSGNIVVSVVAGKEKEGNAFRAFFDYTEPVRISNTGKYLTIRQGEEQGILHVAITIDDTEMTERLCRMFVRPGASAACAELLRRAVADGYRRLLRPSIENEIAASLKDRADDAAIETLSDNLKKILLSQPSSEHVLAIFPEIVKESANSEVENSEEGSEESRNTPRKEATGACRLVVLDRDGYPVADDTIYPNPPANDLYGASNALAFMVDRFMIDVIAIADNSAGQHVQRFASTLQLPRRVRIAMVPAEPSATYAATDEAAAEFPGQDLPFLCAVSLGRRFLNPLEELVKVDPVLIPLGQHQNLVNQPKLRRALTDVVEHCVNYVGVNLNTASAHLLEYVSGIGPSLARNIVQHRSEIGGFESRSQLMEVPRMGEKTYRLSFPFLMIPTSPNRLDAMAIHYDSYPLLEQIAADLGETIDSLAENPTPLHSLDTSKYVSRTTPLAVLTDLILAMQNPGRDPRVPVNAAPEPTGNPSIHDFHVGQLVTGRVSNITPFGVFVDLGIPENGLIHISQLSDDYVREPSDIVTPGQNITVRILDIDVQRSRVALTLKGV